MLLGTKTIVCGGGQIGQAFKTVLACYEPKIVDVALERSVGVITEGDACDVLLIAFPWSTGFVEAVRGYQERFQPKVTVIHSTVEEGTSRQLSAVFSPVVGQHPFLVEGIRSSTRFLAGEMASLVADYYRRAGLKVSLMENSDALEYAKLVQTQLYSVQNVYVRDVAKHCRVKGYSFAEVFTLPSMDYNRMYDEAGLPYHLPLLVPIMQPLGGHCLKPNLELLSGVWSDFIKERDEK